MYLLTDIFENIPRVRSGFTIGAHSLYSIRYTNVTVMLGDTEMKVLNLNCEKKINVNHMNIPRCEPRI